MRRRMEALVLSAVLMTVLHPVRAEPVPSVASSTAPAATTAPAPATSAAPPASTAPARPAAGAAAATAPAAGVAPTPPPTSAPTPATSAPPVKLQYSYVDVATLHTQPYGNHDIGHGQRVDFAYALGDGAYLVLHGIRRNLKVSTSRAYDAGFGFHTTATPGHNFFMELLWSSYSLDRQPAEDISGHDYAARLGIRALPVANLELFADLRYNHDPRLAGRSAGECGFLYHFGFAPSVAAGFSLGANGKENDYLITLRWYY